MVASIPELVTKPGAEARSTTAASLPHDTIHETDVHNPFELPELCQDSALSYVDGGAVRQVAKSRSGDFNEEQLLVGMRFVLI